MVTNPSGSLLQGPPARRDHWSGSVHANSVWQLRGQAENRRRSTASPTPCSTTQPGALHCVRHALRKGVNLPVRKGFRVTPAHTAVASGGDRRRALGSGLAQRRQVMTGHYRHSPRISADQHADAAWRERKPTLSTMRGCPPTGI